jgi:hypothetical protein
LQFGLAEGRQIRSLKRNSECELISRSGFFSKDWYLSRYPDVAFQALTQLNTFSILRHWNFAIPVPFSALNTTCRAIPAPPHRPPIRLCTT